MIARRVSLPGARDDRLYYAQVREDARLELDALRPESRDAIVVVSSGGCTALSLLAAGAGAVAAVDLNLVQNHLVELKVAASVALARGTLLAFLGATHATAGERHVAYAAVSGLLSPSARAYWDDRRAAVGQGVLNAGVTERFIRVVVTALRTLVHGKRRTESLLRCATLEEQREFFACEWDTRAWRAFFTVLLNPIVFRRAYDPAFFRHLERPSFAAHFRARARFTITELPVADNYFLHHMLTGRYPVAVTGGVPLYLSVDGIRGVTEGQERLTLVDGALTEYLRTQPAQSVTGFALSNIAEWLAPPDVEVLFREVARTAAPGARVCFRNFVGWTDVPVGLRDVIVEDRERGEELMRRDRSVVQRRFAICTVPR